MDALEPRRLGFRFVHQDLGLLDRATVLENVRFGLYEWRFGWRIPWRSERRAVRDALRRFAVDVDPDAMVSTLAPLDRAQVAIVRALEQMRGTHQGLLVLDEPTAHLPREEVDRLFATIRSVAATGTGVLLVTHRLEEMRAVTDSLTILRDGEVTLEGPTASMSDDQITEAMLGFALAKDTGTGAAEELDGRPVAVSLRAAGGRRLEDFSVDVRSGEILGFTGLVRAGWEEVPGLFFGIGEERSGSIRVGGAEWRDLRDFSPREAIEAGIGLVPADRLGDGAIGVLSIKENVTLTTITQDYVSGRMREGREKARAQALLEEFDVRPPAPQQPFETLSGGNQQKVMLAKWFATQPRVLVLHEPTQGVDVGARQQLYEKLRSGARAGMAVIIAGTEYEELARVCDRVLVIRDGRVRGELRGERLAEDRIAELAAS